jgi:hypothetical protein
MSVSAQTYAVVQFGHEAKVAMENGTFVGSRNRTSRSGGREYDLGQLYLEAYKSGRLDELTLLECIDAYSSTFQSTRGNVFLVVENSVWSATEAYAVFPKIEHDRGLMCSTETSTTWIYQQFTQDAGVCFAQDGNRFLPRLRANPSMWAPIFDVPVKQCFSESTGQKCNLNFSVALMIVVIVFNAMKALTVLVGISQLRNDPLLTVGDAVKSYLQTPDASSLNMCLASQAGIHRSKPRWQEIQQP